MDSNFYKDINNDLKNKKKDNYLSFIKILYESLKLTTLKIVSNNELYRGSIISKEQIKKIKEYLNNKKKFTRNYYIFKIIFIFHQRP